MSSIERVPCVASNSVAVCVSQEEVLTCPLSGAMLVCVYEFTDSVSTVGKPIRNISPGTRHVLPIMCVVFVCVWVEVYALCL